MRLSRTAKLTYLAMLTCVVLAGALYEAILVIAHLFPALDLGGANLIAYPCYATFVIIWLRLVRYRSLDRRILWCMTSAGLIMLVWLFLRTVKYELLLARVWAMRYIWYSYYVGYAFTPALLLLAVLHLGKRAGERIDRRWWLLLVGAALLSVLVMTNDLHQLAFRFEPGVTVWQASDQDPYTHGPLFYLVWAWLVALALAAMGVAFVRCARAPRRRVLFVPAAILTLGMCSMALYLAAPSLVRVLPYKAPEVSCFLTIAFMESLVALGLFPSNDGYERLWRASSLQGGLMDGQGTIVNAAPDTAQVTSEQVAQALEHPVDLSADRVLAARRVPGGIAFWMRDLARMHELQGRLEEVGDTIAEENAVLTAENDLAHERLALAQRQALYDSIAQRTAGHLDRLGTLLNELPTDDEAFLPAMYRVALEATYVKRCANLTLLGEAGTIDVRELVLAAEETAAWLRSCGVAIWVMEEGAGSVPAEEALRAYESLCEALKGTIDGPDGVGYVCYVGPAGLALRAVSAAIVETRWEMRFSVADTLAGAAHEGATAADAYESGGDAS